MANLVIKRIETSGGGTMVPIPVLQETKFEDMNKVNEGTRVDRRDRDKRLESHLELVLRGNDRHLPRKPNRLLRILQLKVARRPRRWSMMHHPRRKRRS
jgi:hypothetical protein